MHTPFDSRLLSPIPLLPTVSRGNGGTAAPLAEDVPLQTMPTSSVPEEGQTTPSQAKPEETPQADNRLRTSQIAQLTQEASPEKGKALLEAAERLMAMEAPV